MLELLVKTLTPEHCLVCGQPDVLVCEQCEIEHLEPTYPTCYVCSARSENYQTCDACRGTKTRPLNVWSLVRYQSVAKRLIYKMKFDSNRAVAKYIALKLHQQVAYFDFDVVSFVPTARKRVRERGYDHSQLIAREFAKKRGLTVKKLLIRVGSSRQVGANKQLRKAQAETAYQATNTQMPESVLLIDDVISSGATIESAVRVLRQSGVKRVYVAVFARR